MVRRAQLPFIVYGWF